MREMMCVCVVCICVYVCACVCVTLKCACVHVCVRERKRVLESTYVSLHVCAFMCVCMYMWVHVLSEINCMCLNASACLQCMSIHFKPYMYIPHHLPVLYMYMYRTYMFTY